MCVVIVKTACLRAQAGDHNQCRNNQLFHMPTTLWTLSKPVYSLFSYHGFDRR
jgi:hypothetical protein